MTASIAVLRPTGRGRQPLAADAERTAREELDEHCREAVAFVDNCTPLLDAMERVAIELGPRFMAIVGQLQRRHQLYLRRHLDDPDEPTAMERAA